MPTEAFSSPLVTVKRTIPPRRVGILTRDRLEARLARSEAKLVAVVAPAGWGKTSLLAQWASHADGRLAWVTLDEDDDEPIRFWSYLLTALVEASDQISWAALDALRASTAGVLPLVVPTLVNELAAASMRHVVVLDDYQVITDPDIHEGIEYLISYLPPSAQLVIAARWDPPLPLARMRVRGELTEIRADDLRFTLTEATTMVTAVCERALDPETTAGIWERTEGWAAGLQLAALAQRGRPGADADPVRVRGDERHLFDYITSEVLSALDPRQRDLLVRSAPLELLSGPLCDAVLQVADSAAVLMQLERADVFVTVLDDDRGWYRCHGLLRDAVLYGPDSAGESEARETLCRAAHWYEQNHHPDEAVRLLQRAGDSSGAAALLQTYELWFMDQGWAAAYLAHGDRLPETAVGAQLALGLAYAGQVCGRLDRLSHWLDICEQRIDADTVVASWRDPRAAVVTMRAVAVVDTDSALAVELAERAVAMEIEAGVAEPPVALVALGGAYAQNGQFDEAVPILTDAWRQRDRGLWWPGVDLQLAGLLALSLLRSDRTDELDRILAESEPLADAADLNWGHSAPAVLTLLRLVGALRRQQRGELAAARQRLDHAVRLAAESARPTFQVVAQLVSADLELAEGHRSGAQASLTRARELVDTESLPAFVRDWLRDSEQRIGRLAARAAVRPGGLVDQLTDRELSILRMLPGPATQREIGAALFLSINTVKAYNKSLYRKLGAASRQEATTTARRLGLI